MAVELIKKLYMDNFFYSNDNFNILLKLLDNKIKLKFGKTINNGMLIATLGMTASFLIISLLIVRLFHTRIAERI